MDPTTMQADYIERLSCAHGAQLQNYLSEIVGSPEIARELAEDSFAQVRRTYRPEEVSYPRAVLFNVATNFALMHLRRRRLERILTGGAPGVETAQEVSDHRISLGHEASAAQLGEHLAVAVKALRPNLRQVFVMAHVEGRPRKEIAVALGISERRLDKRMTAGLRKCREHLLSHGIDLTDIVGVIAVLPLACILGVN